MHNLLALVGAIIAAGLVWGAAALHIVEFTYPRIIENEPLLAPVEVRKVEGQSFELVDGRRFDVLLEEKVLAELISYSGNRVDVENDGKSPNVYVKYRRHIYGCCLAAPINIPVIPVDIPINQRHMLAAVTNDDSR